MPAFAGPVSQAVSVPELVKTYTRAIPTDFISGRVGVMYLGRRMEIAPKQEFYSNALHPYTKALLSAIPLIDPTKKKERIILKGEVPSPINPPEGCRFCTRCNRVLDACRSESPELREVPPDHRVACHLYG